MHEIALVALFQKILLLAVAVPIFDYQVMKPALDPKNPQ